MVAVSEEFDLPDAPLPRRALGQLRSPQELSELQRRRRRRAPTEASWEAVRPRPVHAACCTRLGIVGTGP